MKISIIIFYILIEFYSDLIEYSRKHRNNLPKETLKLSPGKMLMYTIYLKCLNCKIQVNDHSVNCGGDQLFLFDINIFMFNLFL